MQHLYEPFVGKNLSIANVQGMKKLVENLTENAFLKKYTAKDLAYGKNLLSLKVALKFISNFLQKEISLIQENEKNSKLLLIKALEEELKAQVTVSLLVNKTATLKTINLKGKADRIDTLGGIIRIIDYKTGAIQKNEIEIKDFEQIILDPTIHKGFQLLMYAFMYKQSLLESRDITLESGIITFRNLSAGLMHLKVDKSEVITTAVLDEFEEQLKLLLTEIYSPEIPFTQTENLQNCNYCSYKAICNR